MESASQLPKKSHFENRFRLWRIILAESCWFHPVTTRPPTHSPIYTYISPARQCSISVVETYIFAYTHAHTDRRASGGWHYLKGRITVNYENSRLRIHARIRMYVSLRALR